MAEREQFVELENADLLVARVDKLRKAGYRLAQACVVTRDEVFDVVYSFVIQNDLLNLRLLVGKGEEIESITSIYPYAFLYENEMRELHGLRIRNIAVDFKGELYQTRDPFPFVNNAEGNKETTL